MKYRHLIIGVAVALCCLYPVFRNVSFQEIFESILALKYQYLPFAVILFALSFVIRAYRWHFLCRSVKIIPTKRLYSPMIIGFMGNLLPLRIGEFIRALLLGNREGIGFTASFATIVVERIFDMIGILVLFAGLLIFNSKVFVPQGGENSETIASAVQSFGVMSLVLCVVLVMFCYFLLHQQERTLGLVRFFTRILPKKIQTRIEEMLRAFTAGLGILRDPKGIFWSVFLTGPLWVVLFSVNYPLYYCYQIESMLPLSSLVTLLVVTCAAIAVIPAPGFLGPFQMAVAFVLADLYGIDKAVAASFSLVTWFLQMAGISLAGTFFLIRDNESFFELSRTAKEAADKEAEQLPASS